MEHHAEVLKGGVWHQRIPSRHDLAAVLLVLGTVILLGAGGRQMVAPFVVAHQAHISLSPAALPFYALRTVLRMLATLILSLIFTFTYATLAAKAAAPRWCLIPLLDVLQSVPILGYLSFTVVFFISLFPGYTLGPELAAIFAIFTSQAWNMAFSFYQAPRTVPRDLDEASRSFRSSVSRRFWRLEVPFAMPGLVWNMMMSMSGGWFFVVAAEAISVGDTQIALPGVGSYVARAIQERDLAAVGWAIGAMTVAIILYDQLLFRPMVVWADKTCRLVEPAYLAAANGLAKSATSPSSSSISSRRLHLAMRSLRESEPHLIWPPPIATASTLRWSHALSRRRPHRDRYRRRRARDAVNVGKKRHSGWFFAANRISAEQQSSPNRSTYVPSLQAAGNKRRNASQLNRQASIPNSYSYSPVSPSDPSELC
jgi:ABC-type nitrate/sulfonate/bicarbonate transport system permease component